MKNLLPKKSKRGVTLVECMVAVVILGLLAAGVLNLLTAGGTKIARLSKEAADQAKATQMLDLVISAISNGSDEYIIKDTKDETTYCCLDIVKLTSVLNIDATVTAKFSMYDDTIKDTLDTSSATYTKTLESGLTVPLQPLLEIRGWYLTLSYTGQSGKEITVTGFASNSEGVFDQQ